MPENETGTALEDAPELHRLAQAGEVARMMLHHPHPYEEGTAEEWIRGLRPMFESDKGTTFAVVLREGGTLIGTVSLYARAPDGTVVMFGNSSGEPSEIAFGSVLASPRAKLYAFFVYASAAKETFGEDLALLASLVGSGKLRPQVGFEAGWREVGRAVDALRGRRIEGKAVLRVE